MKASIRFASSAEKEPTSLNVSTWRSGITSRCVSALGAMSRIATNPSPRATWSPSRARRQKRQSSGSADPLLGHLGAADADELAHRRGDEPRRVVVAVPAAGPVDEHHVLAADLPAPAGVAGGLRGVPQP